MGHEAMTDYVCTSCLRVEEVKSTSDGVFRGCCPGGWLSRVDSVAGRAALERKRCEATVPPLPLLPDVEGQWCPNEKVDGEPVCGYHREPDPWDEPQGALW